MSDPFVPNGVVASVAEWVGLRVLEQLPPTEEIDLTGLGWQPRQTLADALGALV